MPDNRKKNIGTSEAAPGYFLLMKCFRRFVAIKWMTALTMEAVEEAIETLLTKPAPFEVPSEISQVMDNH